MLDINDELLKLDVNIAYIDSMKENIFYEKGKHSIELKVYGVGFAAKIRLLEWHL